MENLKSDLDVKNIDVLFTDDDRQHETVMLTLAGTHQERARYRRH